MGTALTTGPYGGLLGHLRRSFKLFYPPLMSSTTRPVSTMPPALWVTPSTPLMDSSPSCSWKKAPDHPFHYHQALQQLLPPGWSDYWTIAFPATSTSTNLDPVQHPQHPLCINSFIPVLLWLPSTYLMLISILFMCVYCLVYLFYIHITLLNVCTHVLLPCVAPWL